MFLARYASDGSNIGVKRYGEGYVGGIAVDPEENVLFTGTFRDTLTLGENTFISHGTDDFFIAKSAPLIGGDETQQHKSDNLFIYANPTTGICNITIPEGFQHETDLSLFIYDNNGKLIQSIPVHFDQDKISFNIQAEAKGLYNAVLTNGKKYYTGKIIFY